MWVPCLVKRGKGKLDVWKFWESQIEHFQKLPQYDKWEVSPMKEDSD